MDPTIQSISFDVYNVKENNKSVGVYQVNETENERDEEEPQESINTDDLPSNIDLSELHKTDKNVFNESQQHPERTVAV